MGRSGLTTALDLPQLYTHPSAADLITTLALLAVEPASWDSKHHLNDDETQAMVDETGVPKYLTGIIASQLVWIDEQWREEIWEAASKRLSERSGRAAIPSVSRTFVIPDPFGNSSLSITLHEPSLTSDNLGHKTWVSSYLLAKRLPFLRTDLPSLQSDTENEVVGAASRPSKISTRILELGAGTGLVGIVAAALFHVPVHLTDLPAIVPNLQANVLRNRQNFANAENTTTGVLDWSDFSTDDEFLQKADVILSADPLYSPLHPALLANAIERLLNQGETARVIVALPLRKAYVPEVEDFKVKMKNKGLTLLGEGNDVGYDDWEGSSGSEFERLKRLFSLVDSPKNQKDIKAYRPIPLDNVAKVGARLLSTTESIAALPVIFIAEIDGHAKGAGNEITSSWDFRYAGPTLPARKQLYREVDALAYRVASFSSPAQAAIKQQKIVVSKPSMESILDVNSIFVGLASLPAAQAASTSHLENQGGNA
ncbi:hypothetical protein MMC07_001027 [Pseudocyphellaria aurata]|nr:hypothetical protein [Pseudocyphellaria aurata]